MSEDWEVEVRRTSTRGTKRTHGECASPVDIPTDDDEPIELADGPQLISIHTQDPPVLILIGPSKHPYYIHKGLLASKSPFFRTMFKDCWDGTKQQIELPSISCPGFDFVIHWMYTGGFPSKFEAWYPDPNTGRTIDYAIHAIKAADILMIPEVQDGVIGAESVTILMSGTPPWTAQRLKEVWDADLSHTTYYKWTLKAVVHGMMVVEYAGHKKRWESDIKVLQDDAELLADVLRCIGEWQRDPWEEFPKGV